MSYYRINGFIGIAINLERHPFLFLEKCETQSIILPFHEYLIMKNMNTFKYFIDKLLIPLISFQYPLAKMLSIRV